MPVNDEKEEDAKFLVRATVKEDMPCLRFTKVDKKPSGQRKHIVEGWSVEGVLFNTFKLSEQPKMYTFMCNGSDREKIGYFLTSPLTHINLDDNLNGMIETQSGSTYKVERLKDGSFKHRY